MSVYRVIDVIGTSTTSWEEAAADAINTASQSLVYRTKIQLSFKYEGGS